MNLEKTLRSKWNPVGLAFVFTFLGFLLLMIVKGVLPFGEGSFLYSDSYHQYYPFFLAFRKALRAGDSLLYSWNVGMGMDYLGLISYYLASPLNLLSVILPEKWMLVYFTFLTPIKLSFASMFFALFLKKTFGKDDISVALFGCFYGLCAWALAYLWNIMWLDTFALLPLVILGMISLLKQRKFAFYTFTLFLSIFVNYYIGFFICIFVLLVFFCYEVCRWKGWKAFFIDLALMALFSGLAIAMTAILELPTLAALQTTQSSVNSFPEGFKLNIADENTWKGLLNAMGQVAGNMNGGLEPSFKEGLPNLYCGLFANAFGILFLFSRNIRLLDKICAVLLLLFFNVSFIIRQLDYIWHGFHFTNMIPYRFSFLHSFVWLWMAYRAYLVRRHFRLWQIILAGALSVGLVACSESRTDTLFLAYNGAFLLLYLAVLVYTHHIKKLPSGADPMQTRKWLDALHQKRSYGKNCLIIVIAIELVLVLVNFSTSFAGTSITHYPRGTEYTASMIRYMHEREWDEPFFRAETTNSQTLNDGALNDYNGISTFTSSANVKVTAFMKRLGYGAKNTYNRYCFEESSPVSNLFLGIKYMIERSGRVEENPYFTDLHSYGDVHLLENNVYLPLGFLANSELTQVDFASRSSDIDFQNDLFTAATGIPDRVWKFVYGDCLTISANDATLTEWDNGGVSNYTTQGSSGSINYRYTFQEEGFLCVSLDLPNRNNFTFYLNGNELYSDSYSIPQSAAVCQVHPGDVVDISLSCNANESGRIIIRAGLLNETIFRQGYEILSASTLKLDSFKTTHLSGSISCNRDGLMYTSIPQDGNWKVYVDGKLAKPALVGDVMISVPLTEGEHHIEFIYRNAAFALGWKISLLCTALLIGLSIWQNPPRRKNAK